MAEVFPSNQRSDQSPLLASAITQSLRKGIFVSRGAMMEEKGIYATEQEDSVNNALAMIGWDRQIEIQDEGDLRKYRIELPNLYDDSDLDPYEFRLLAHYKRVGRCTEGTKTTARICKMSPMQVSVKRKSLAKKHFISMQSVDLPDGGYSYIIKVLDRWQENFNKYAPLTPHVPPLTPHVLKKVVVAVDTATLYTTYSSEIGVITTMIADSIDDWAKDVPAEWIISAIREAATQNKRNWKYCTAILKRWQAQGFMDTEKPKQEESTGRGHSHAL